MQDGTQALSADWPKWESRSSSWWLTAFGASFTVLYLGLTVYPHFWRRLLIASILSALSALLVSFLIHAFGIIGIAFRRCRKYDELHLSLNQNTEELARARLTIRELYQQVAGTLVFEIEKVLYYRDTLSLVLKKRRGRKLAIKDRIVVIDNVDGAWFGFFEVSEIGSSITATGYDVNPVWLGFVRQSKQIETPPPPGTMAISTSKDGGDDD